MEDLQVIIYIVFGIIYLIFGALKKRRQGPEAGPPPLFDEEEVPQRRRAAAPAPDDEYESEPGSLEELLERYDQAAQRAQRRSEEKIESMQEQVDDEFIPVAPNEPTIRNMEQEALEQMQRTEYLKSVQEELPAKARAEVLSKEPPAFTSPKPKKRLGRKKERQRISKFKFSDHKKKKPLTTADKIRAQLSNREGFKQAFILTEVINRKHF